MKKILNKLGGLAVLALLLVNCAPVERDTDTLDSILNARKTLTQSESYYLGQNTGGEDVFSLRLMSNSVGVDFITSSDVIKENSYQGEGYFIYMELNAVATAEHLFPVGTFDVADAFSNFYYIILHNGESATAAEKIKVLEGTVTVTKSGDNYTVAIDATNIVGSKLEASFSGKIEVAPTTVYINEPLEGTLQNFDVTEISFVSENVDVDRDYVMDMSLGKLTLKGEKGLVVIDEIVGPIYPIGGEPKKPVPGSYTLTEWSYEDKSFTPGEIYNTKLTGSYAWQLYNAATPSFSAMWYFVEAQMLVAETATTYTITIQATSANGSTINATYVENK